VFRLIPREEKFFEMFEAAARNIHRGAELLVEMMEDYHDPEKQADAILQVEHQGDTITHDIIHKLNQTFITPIDREDIYSLAGALDDVLDLIEAVSDRMLMYRVQEPTEVAKQLAELNRKLLQFDQRFIPAQATGEREVNPHESPQPIDSSDVVSLPRSDIMSHDV